MPDIVRYTGKPQVKCEGEAPGDNHVISQCDSSKAKGTTQPEGKPVPMTY